MIALVGNPNTGKSALFNALTGSRQKVANYPGVTVEKKEGLAITSSGRKIRVLDLPGAYSLDAKTPDEAITRDVLLGRLEKKPEKLIVVADATNLERTLAFVLELRELNIPLVVALNMVDLGKKRGFQIDLKLFEKELGLPVVETVAIKKRGVKELLEKVVSCHPPLPHFSKGGLGGFDGVKKRFEEVDRILMFSLRQGSAHHAWTEKIDRLVLHPVWGSLILGIFLVLMFQAIFSWAKLPMEAIQNSVGFLGERISLVMPEGPLKNLLVNGVIAGVGAVVVFLPQILLLFFFILLLEDSGYMARAAFLMDHLMGKVGLNGRAFVPLLSSHACAIPGIMSARTIENPRDRIATILMAPLTTCSARLPVYALLVGAFIPQKQILGSFNLQGLVLLGLYVAGIISALITGFVLKHTVLTGPKPFLLMELPTYKIPTFKNIFLGLFGRAKIFLRRAGTLILCISIVLWFLVSYPKPSQQSAEPAIHYSLAGRMGHILEPVLKPIGFDWKIATGLIPGFAAREVMVGALSTVYAVDGGKPDIQKLGVSLASQWSLATALSLLVWYIFAPQCVATLAVVRRETNSWRWPGLLFAYMLFLAYSGSLVTYHVATLMGLG